MAVTKDRAQQDLHHKNHDGIKSLVSETLAMLVTRLTARIPAVNVSKSIFP